MTAFEEFGVLPELGKAVDDMGWTLPTDVQSEAIPLILGGGDVLMAAETGSGKTGAFCLPVLQIVWEALKDLREGKAGKKAAGSGGGGSDSGWKMSFHDRGSQMAVTPDGLKCQSRHQKEWHGCRATMGVAGKGRYYYEALVTDEGLCRVGFSTDQASLDLGTCAFGYGYGGTGKKSNSRQFDDYGGPFGKADVIGCYLDLDNMEVAYTKNGKDLGLAFPIPRSQYKDNFFPSVVLKNAEMAFNFGDQPWKHPPEEGFVGFSSAKEKDVVKNRKSGGSGVEQRKIVNNAPQALIIEPSRELAEQTLNQIQKFKAHLGAPMVKELLVVGGTKAKDQIDALQAGVDIVVATPGRLEDLINNQLLSLKQCRFFILDEADGLLKAGYDQLIRRIHGSIPKMTSDGTRLQMIVCSATLHAFEVKKLADSLMHFPTWVDLKGQDSVPDTVHHVVLPCNPRVDSSWANIRHPTPTDQVHARDRVGPGQDTPEAWSEAVKWMKAEYCVAAIKKFQMDHGIIFCRTKLDCDNLERHFRSLPDFRTHFSCVCLHGDRKPQERKANLEKFKAKEVRFLICTDVAARGLDVKGLPYMINVTLPDEKSNYVHRIGRVGRAERMGLAISLVSEVREKVWYHGEWCSSRGRNCSNTRLTKEGGCCIWYDEPQYLADIEEHLGVTIQQIGKDLNIQVDEFDGKVVYGEKRRETGTGYAGHASQLAPTLAELAKLEKEAQNVFLHRFYNAAPTKA